MVVSAMFEISNFSTSSPTLDITNPFYFGGSAEDVCTDISLQLYFLLQFNLYFPQEIFIEFVVC